MNLKELRKYCIDNHREMWHWLAENPNEEKKDWPGWEHHNDDIFNKKEKDHCFICGYISADLEKNCDNCPLDWVITDMCEEVYPRISYYILYRDAITHKAKTKYAEIIANLPEKDDAK